MGATERCDSLGRPSDLHLRRSLAPEQVEEKFAGRTAEPSHGFAVPNHVPLVGSRPFDLEPDPAQPATQVATTSADISPESRLQRGGEGAAGASVVRPAHVLVVDEELVQVRKRADPSDAEEPGRWTRPDPLDEPREFSVLRQPHPASLGEPLERSMKYEAGTRDEIALAQHEVGGKVPRSPVPEQSGTVGPDLCEEIAKCKALLGVKRKTTHRSPTVPAATPRARPPQA